jgi:hypothetical protein
MWDIERRQQWILWESKRERESNNFKRAKKKRKKRRRYTVNKRKL